MEKSALVYLFLTVITVGLALLIKNKEYAPSSLRRGYGSMPYHPADRRHAANTVAEVAIYCLLTGVSACRIAVGNDYWVYRFNFNLIMQNRHVSSETGFNLVVRGIQGLFGYDAYLPVFAFFSIVTVLFFVLALHDQGEIYAFSLFLLMTGGYYFNSLNSVRYYLALAIALFSMKYVLRREIEKFLFWVLLGAVFHKSVLLVIPVYLLAAYLAGTKLKKWHYAVFTLFLLSLLFGQSIYRALIFRIYPFYENTSFDNGRISYANVAKCLGVIALYAIASRFGKIRQKEAYRFYYFLTVFGLVAFCCGSFVPEVTRIGYYMIISQVFLIPGLLDTLEKGWKKRLLFAGCIAAFTLYFGLLIKQMYQVDIRLLPYLNWIFN